MGYANRESYHEFFCDKLNDDVIITVMYHQDEYNHFAQYECGRECSERDVSPFTCPEEFYDID